MKRNILQKKISNEVMAIFTGFVMFLMGQPVYAQQRLTKAKTVLESVQTELSTIVPIAAAVMLLCLAIGYAGRFIEKDTFVRWAIGVIIAGSATQIATTLFKP
ncbi:TrwL protein [Bartonella australis AUST/NH1]|uniref:TrwL protein n=1 Tax=Bartonella australis (strain Aust/NH1) TaxID=1094489 RepID=M1NUX2_BARAA|nr:VirB2 family type IV secretion system major pilin TrwL [Bartonella australis]AGF75068.1 TrwL protein [Bartonella australis AUST/NH1]